MRISVIIPAYKATETLADTLQSAISQVISTYDERFPRGGVWPSGPSMIERLCRSLGHKGEVELLGPLLDLEKHSIEVIVVNDGSPDDTMAVAQELARHSPPEVPIKVIDKPNGGPASARNLGIQHATGDLIAFLDADDLWVPRKLARQIEPLVADDSNGMAFTDTFYFRHSGIYSPPGLKLHLRRGGDIFDSLMTEVNFIPNLTVVVRRDVLDAIIEERGGQGPFDEDPQIISSEDYDLWLRVSARSRVAYVRERLAWYRVHAGSLNWRSINKSHHADRTVVERMAEHPRGAHIPRARLTARLARSWYDEGYEHAEAGAPNEAIRCHLRSLKLHPTRHATKGLIRSALQSLPGLRVTPSSVAERGRDDVSF